MTKQITSTKKVSPRMPKPLPEVHYVLPFKWSLHYVMKEGEWKRFRNLIKGLNPDWNKCPTCPKHCNAIALDEDWNYDKEAHVKRFVGAKFICSGCHWLKTPPWRIDTWQRSANGVLAPPTSPPHIISCLGWTQDRVDALRKHDLEMNEREVTDMRFLEWQVKQGLAEIRFWTVDLSALQQYGYMASQIQDFEGRMHSRTE